MSGTESQHVVTLLSGESATATKTFNVGTPAQPIAIGSAAEWSVNAEGVGPVHVYLAFDGESLFAASAAQDLDVLLAGSFIGTQWSKAPVPCELRFGGACLIMTRTGKGASQFPPAAGGSKPPAAGAPQGAGAPPPGAAGFWHDEHTVHDGGALYQAAQRAVAAAHAVKGGGAPGNAESGEHGPATIPQPFPNVRPAAGSPALAATQAVQLPHTSPAGSAPPPNMLGATVPLGYPSPTAQPQQYPSRPPGASHSSAPPAASYSSTPPPAGMGPGLSGPQGNVPPNVSAQGWAPPVRPGSTPGVQGMAQGQGQVGQLGQQPGQPGTPQAAQPGQAPPAEKPAGYWQSASPVKKAIIILMPFTLIMSYFMLQPEDAPPPAKVVAPAGSRSANAAADGGHAALNDGAPDAGAALTNAANPASTAPDDAGATAAVTPPATADTTQAVATAASTKDGTKDGAKDGSDAAGKSPPKVAALPPGKRTLERQAVDAVAAGSFADALKLYEQLEAQHPDDPTFKEAARILKEKTERKE
jgi:hypothetical protein